jgi:hypothetical protein
MPVLSCSALLLSNSVRLAPIEHSGSDPGSAFAANTQAFWQRLYRRGSRSSEVRLGAATLLPVEVSTPTILPSERAVAHKVVKADRAALSVAVDFADFNRGL